MLFSPNKSLIPFKVLDFPTNQKNMGFFFHIKNWEVKLSLQQLDFLRIPNRRLDASHQLVTTGIFHEKIEGSRLGSGHNLKTTQQFSWNF